MKFSFIFDYKDYIENIVEKKSIDDLFIYDQFETSYIKEGLIKTQPADKSLEIIKRRFNINGEVKEDGEIELWDLEKELDSYVPIINNLGYFIASKLVNNKWYRYSDKVDGKVENIVIEAKYDIIINDIPDILYHTSLSKNDNRIENIGLTPRSGNKLSNHPDRIYLTDDINVAHKFGEYLEHFDDVGDGGYTIWTIHTNGLDVKLYSDVNFRGKGFYTTTNIPPNHLSH